MKPFVFPTVIAAAAMLLAACDNPKPTPPPNKSGFHPPGETQQPAANPDVHPDEPAVAPHSAEPNQMAQTPSKPSPPVPASPSPKEKLLYGKPVPGKPGYVFNPYDDSKGYIDVRGFPPGTEVKDPYTGNNFLVP